MTKGRSVGRFPRGREERGERKGLRVVMMRALVEEFDGARDAEVCWVSGDCAEVCFVLFDVLMTNVGEDERDDSICLTR